MIRQYSKSDFSQIESIYNLSKKDEFSKEDFTPIVLPLAEDEVMLRLFNESNIYVYEKENILGFAGYRDKTISWLLYTPSIEEKVLERF